MDLSLLEVNKHLCDRARDDFWVYEKLSNPTFFKEDRPHLKILAKTLQDFVENKLLNKDGVPYKILGISLPPRVGKSYSLTEFCQWLLGVDNQTRIATVSYNENIAGEFSMFVRDGIQEEKMEDCELVYSDIFPDTKIKHGNASARKWALEGQFFNYIGTGMNGSLTGKGFKIGIIDDPVKNAIEAFDDKVLEKHYNFYKNTFRSRIESGGKIIVNHTRWSSNDLLGRLLEDQPNKIYHLVMKMENDEGELLCEDMVDREEWDDLQDTIDPNILSANYKQIPIDAEGRMYKSFKTYKPDDNPSDIMSESYTDTADTGADFLCSIAYKYNKDDGFVYIQDVLYTQDSMEKTEPATAKQFEKVNLKLGLIESNNGGRGFARNVEKELCDNLGYNGAVIKWFHQSENKEARIFSQSHWVTENVLFPEGWAKRWPEFYLALSTHSKEGKNKHDDAADAITGVAEQCTKDKALPTEDYDFSFTGF